MSQWEELQVADKVRGILGELRQGYPYANYAGNPFFSAYQLAIELKRRFPDDFSQYTLGGERSGDPYPLPAYIARFLPQAKDAADIETAFLHEHHLAHVSFAHGVEPSTPYLIVFRLRQDQ